MLIFEFSGYQISLVSFLFKCYEVIGYISTEIKKEEETEGCLERWKSGKEKLIWHNKLIRFLL